MTDSDEEGYVNLLTEEGKIEGRIIETVDFDKKTVEFMFNDEPYEMSLKDGKSVMVNESKYEVGDHFELNGVDITIENISENTTTLSVKIFDGKDLAFIQGSRTGFSRITKQGSNYVFAVPVELSNEASEKYEKTTKNLEVLVDPATGESFSKYPISIFIDGEQFISVPILSGNMGKKTQNLILWSFSPNIKEATKNMVRLKTIIEMKSLPQELTLVKKEEFKSTYGELLTTSLLFFILIASVFTTLLFFVKFRKNGVASLPLILMVLSELVLIFGVVSANWFALIIFCVGVVVIFAREGVYDWRGWVGVFLFFMLVIGVVMSKWSGGWIINAPFIMGLMGVVLIGFGQNVFVGMRVLTKKESYTSSDYKNTLKKLWSFSTVLGFILMISYFIFNFIDLMSTEFIMATSIGVWINLSLILPVYTDITKKLIK